MYAKFLRGTITGLPNWIDFENSYSLTDSSSPKVMSWMIRNSVSDNARTEMKNDSFFLIWERKFHGYNSLVFGAQTSLFLLKIVCIFQTFSLENTYSLQISKNKPT